MTRTRCLLHQVKVKYNGFVEEIAEQQCVHCMLSLVCGYISWQDDDLIWPMWAPGVKSLQEQDSSVSREFELSQRAAHGNEPISLSRRDRRANNIVKLQTIASEPTGGRVLPTAVCICFAGMLSPSHRHRHMAGSVIVGVSDDIKSEAGLRHAAVGESQSWKIIMCGMSAKS